MQMMESLAAERNSTGTYSYTGIASNDSSTNGPGTDWRTPLLLSSLAGLSTCLGAAVVFCANRRNDDEQHQQGLLYPQAPPSSSSSSSRTVTGGRQLRFQTQRQRQRVLGHGHMAFSLSLAGSVMITVSVFSILPECFLQSDDKTYVTMGSAEFVQRCAAFCVGCALYVLLSKCAFPEPDAILGFEDSDNNNMVDDIIGDNNYNINNEYNNVNGKANRSSMDFLGESDDMLLLDDDLDDVLQPLVIPLPLLQPQVVLSNGGTSMGATSSSSSTAFQRKRAATTTTTTTHGSTAMDELRLQEDAFSLPRAAPTSPERMANGGGDGDDDTKTKNEGNSNNRRSSSPSSFLLSSNMSSSAAKCASLFSVCSQFTRGTDLAHDAEARRAWRVAMLLFVSLAVHNFPEGLAVAASAMHSPRLGVTTTIAIALHNIPEGIAIAIPCLAARPDSPWLAFWLASLSGLAEPLGAAVALAVLDRDSSNNERDSTNVDQTLGSVLLGAILNMQNVLAFVAGIMITVAAVELFPEAKRHMKENRVPGILGTLTGAIVMLASDAYLDS